MTPIKVALAQFESHAEPRVNRDKLVELALKAAEQGAQVVAFHELATTNYFCYYDDPAPYFSLAEPVPGPTTAALEEVANAVGVSVVLPLYERDGDERYNTVAYIEPARGITQRYRKTHIPVTGPAGAQKGADEGAFFSAGDTGFTVWDAGAGVRAASLVCFDRHFPEGARSYALDGVHVIFVPTASYREFIVDELWEAGLQSMAFQNGLYVAGINKVGPVLGDGVPSGARYPGRSLVVGPDGRIIAKAGAGEEILLVDVDPATVEEMRSSGVMRFLDRRRPELYGHLVS